MMKDRLAEEREEDGDRGRQVFYYIFGCVDFQYALSQ